MEETAARRELRIGYVGLGDMGQAMALNLASRGWRLTVSDLRPARAEPLQALGARVAASAREAAAASDILCVCVVDAGQVEAVLFGPGSGGGAADGLAPGAVVVDHSTIGAHRCRAIAEKLAARGLGYIDAPVSGAALRARAGELSIAVGGEAAHVARCLSLLKDEATTVEHMGGVGAGQITKLLNNGLFATQVSFIDETIRLGEAMGLDGLQLWTFINSGASGSWSSAYYGSQVAQAGGKRDPASVFGRADDPDGSLRIITKDVSLFVEQLRASGLGATRMAQVAERALTSIGEPLQRE